MLRLQELDAFFRHPLTLTVAGFALTGILGTYVTNRLHNAEAERAVAEAQRDRGIAAIHEIVDLINERRTRAVMVSSAIKRHSPAEAQARKAAYDDIYVRWNTREDSILNQVQEFWRVAAPGDSRGYIDDYAHSFKLALTSDHAVGPRQGDKRADRSQGGLLSRMDDCVTNAFDDYRRGEFNNPGPAKATLQACRFDVIDDRMIDCTHVLTEQLYDIINHLGGANRTHSTEDPLKTNIWQIHGGCEPPSTVVQEE
jgi:hypothetical protein